MPSEPSTIPKSITEACSTLISGPAAITEARKNRKKHMKESEQTDVTPSVPAKLISMTLTVMVPVEAVTNNANSSGYPPSKPSHTLPPIPMPPFFNNNDSSPLSSLMSNIGAVTTPCIPPALLHTRYAPHPPPQCDQDHPHSNTTPDNPHTLTSLLNQEEDMTMMYPPEHTEDTSGISIHSLVEKTPQALSPNNHGAIHDPLDNYTSAKMPKVHDTHPTSPFQYIDLDLISEWEHFVGRKLLIIPFGNAGCKAKLHDLIKNRILYAIAEITQSQGIGVSAPTPTAEAIQSN
ncbi:hypothetical protein EI94DRAFT_1805336 [Lactarius quietus]|nr:hypothetical protein EI94DRAFT_1805336 [Lactarius quietus]